MTNKKTKTNKKKYKKQTMKQRGGTQEEKDNYLFDAIEIDDADKVTRALNNGADVNAKNNDGNTVLIEASKTGHTEIVTILLEKGADVNAKDNYGWTALICASANGHTEIMAMLLKKGTDVNATSNTGLSALHIASLNGHAEIVEKLLEEGANVNAKNNDSYTALMWASEHGHIEIVRDLLKNGADVNAKDDNDYTALMWAVEFGHSTIVDLLEKAIKTEQKIRGNKQAAMELVRDRHEKVPSLHTLIHRDIDSNVTNLYNNAVRQGTVPPPGRGSKLGGKRKTRKPKNTIKRHARANKRKKTRRTKR